LGGDECGCASSATREAKESRGELSKPDGLGDDLPEIISQATETSFARSYSPGIWNVAQAVPDECEVLNKDENCWERMSKDPVMETMKTYSSRESGKEKERLSKALSRAARHMGTYTASNDKSADKDETDGRKEDDRGDHSNGFEHLVGWLEPYTSSY
jgi:hypothetical protein